LVLASGCAAKALELRLIDPKLDELSMSRLSASEWVYEGRTLVCGKIQGRLVDRGERLIKSRDSWFSVKSIEVECCGLLLLVEH